MTKGFHKKQSKRMTMKRRYKIEKKVKQHNQKLKKLARKQKQDRRARKEQLHLAKTIDSAAAKKTKPNRSKKQTGVTSTE